MKQYNEHNGKTYKYLIRNNSNNSGKDFYQIKEVGSNPAYSQQNRVLEPESNNIISNQKQTLNPPSVQDTKIFTREQMDKMSLEEFSQNEAAIMKQLKEKGIPTNRELEQSSKTKQAAKTKSSGKGHWVTIKGNHVFIED